MQMVSYSLTSISYLLEQTNSTKLYTSRDDLSNVFEHLGPTPVIAKAYCEFIVCVYIRLHNNRTGYCNKKPLLICKN